ncbi:hypothetical protein SMD20_09100 [Nonomuraea sp. LP-02]|uniref:hypothetical protein n=1 Tax=Nonomuraea sp. LP-02 TaxID=3097960 RepID=UPI002E363224|nr:hypothetical protein [Nonomuraea sp. LP-02]MED7924387.1 hypothetical protein [Nonomuraea sp. LP-02]
MIEASTAWTHLFPGAAVVLPGPDELRPVGLVINFADGARAQAEVLLPAGGGAAGALLSVTAHTTGAGTALPARMWLIRAAEPGPDGLVLRLGGRVPPGSP